MRREHLRYLACPDCGDELRLEPDVEQVETGVLRCVSCSRSFPVVRHVPRFADSEYASGFGLQWQRHAETQYDSRSASRSSERRFFSETGWPREMPGEVIVEAGCGGGRFTEQAASTGAIVLAFDLSEAVDANYRLNGSAENVLIAQADLRRLPLSDGIADRVFCFGVLQHTPDPEASFMALPRLLKPGGELAADLYIKSVGRFWTQTKYLVRPLTKRLPPERLYRLVRRYVDLMWPVASVIRRVPAVGPQVNWRLLVADYSDVDVPASELKEWAYLDTFDMLNPAFDKPQTVRTVQRWLEKSGLRGRVFRGLNGVAVVARKPT